MDVRILGPLVVSEDGRAIDLGIRQARTVFVVLALQAGSPVRISRLAEILWPDGPPSRWEAAMYSHISRLRRALEPDRAPRAPSKRLATEGDSYVLHLEEAELDARRFEQLAAAGRAALAQGHLEQADDLYCRALAEWRGPVLADFRDPALLSPEVGRLEELRVLAAEERAEAALGRGEHRRAIGDLEALVSENPLRERGWELLLLALYRSGRQTEALRRFREVRGILVEELGIEPGPALCELEHAILRHEADLAPARDVPRDDTRRDVPLPGWLNLPRDAFVGRSSELDMVLESFARTHDAGERRLALVVGEPGMGKTRLVREASAKLHDAGSLVLGGRCPETPLHMLQPFADAIERLALSRAEELRRGAPEDAAVLATLIPELAHHTSPQPVVEGEAYRYLLYRAVSRLLDSKLADRPALLVLDDLHWATPASLQLLAHLLADADRGPLLIVATARDTEPNESLAALVADLRRDRRLDRLSLAGLSPDEVAALAESRGAGPVSPDLYALARGNPFYVEELVRHVVESGGILEADTLPDSVRETIAHRLLRLPADVRRILGVAAVAGAEFRLDVVARAAGVEEDAADEAMAAAVTVGIVAEQSSPAGTYGFSHTLIQAVLLDGLGAARRARVHRRCGEALAALGGEDIAVARQLLAATADSSDVVPGAEAALTAATGAVERYAYDDAVAILRAALDALGTDAADPGLMCRVLTAFAMSLRQVGRYDERAGVLETAWSQAARTSDLELLAAVVLEAFDGIVAPPEPWPARAEEIRTQLATSSPRRVLLTAICANVTSSEPGDRARRLAEWALARINLLGPKERGVALEACILSLTAWSPIERITDLARAQLDAARASGSIFDMVQAQSVRRFVHLAAGDLEASDEAARDYEAMVRTVQVPRFMAGVEQRRAMRALLAGRFTEAEAHAGTAVSLQPLPEFVEGFAVQLFALRFEQGRLDEVRSTVETWTAQDKRAAWTLGHAALLAEIGELDAAAATIRPLVETGFEDVPRDDNHLLALGVAAVTVVQIGDRDAAVALRDRLSPHASRVVVAGQGALCWGSVHRFLGPLNALLDEGDRACMHFEAAMSVHERLGALPFVARDRLAYADLLTSGGGDHVRIGDLRRTGLALARRLEMRTLLGRHEPQAAGETAT